MPRGRAHTKPFYFSNPKAGRGTKESKRGLRLAHPTHPGRPACCRRRTPPSPSWPPRPPGRLFPPKNILRASRIPSKQGVRGASVESSKKRFVRLVRGVGVVAEQRQTPRGEVCELGGWRSLVAQTTAHTVCRSGFEQQPRATPGLRCPGGHLGDDVFNSSVVSVRSGQATAPSNASAMTPCVFIQT